MNSGWVLLAIYLGVMGIAGAVVWWHHRRRR